MQLVQSRCSISAGQEPRFSRDHLAWHRTSLELPTYLSAFSYAIDVFQNNEFTGDESG
jgi:hypothetical protein